MTKHRNQNQSNKQSQPIPSENKTSEEDREKIGALSKELEIRNQRDEEIKENLIDLGSLTNTPKDDILDHYAMAIIEKLEPARKEFFMEVSSNVLNCRPWQLILGAVSIAVERAELTSVIIDPAWEAVPNDMTKTCPECRNKFEPTRISQIFCSNECGAAKDKAIVRKKVEEAERVRVIEEEEKVRKQEYIDRRERQIEEEKELAATAISEESINADNTD